MTHNELLMLAFRGHVHEAAQFAPRCDGFSFAWKVVGRDSLMLFAEWVNLHYHTRQSVHVNADSFEAMTATERATACFEIVKYMQSSTGDDVTE